MASHRLIQMIGKRYGLQVSEAIYDVLNVYYFVEGHALNDRPRLAQRVADELVNLKVPSPLTAAELQDFLTGSQGRAEIERALQRLQELGVHGIPKFIVDGTTVIDGAAHWSVFVDLFRQLEETGVSGKGPIFGDLLGVSPEIIQQGSYSSQELETA